MDNDRSRLGVTQLSARTGIPWPHRTYSSLTSTLVYSETGCIRKALLQRACTLIPTHGFTRQTLSLAGALSSSSQAPSGSTLPGNNEGPSSVLSEASITALFGPGDDACRTLIRAWMDDATARSIPQPPPTAIVPTSSLTLKTLLASRLRENALVLSRLPEAFALLAAPDVMVAGRTVPALPLLDPRPGLSHAWNVAHRACLASGLGPTGTEWYTRRAAVAGTSCSSSHSRSK
jgi:ubiquinone biosynthesis protein COQ9